MKNKHITLFVLPISLLVLISNLYVQVLSPRTNDQSLEPLTINITAVGDLMCHSDQFIYAKVEKDSFDFQPYFSFVKDEFAKGDIVIGNLETVLNGAKSKYTGYPMFNSPDDYAYSLKQTGFTMLSLANNHSLDRGGNGIVRTLQVARDAGLHTMGTAASAAERDSLYIVNIKGAKVGFICYTYGTNGNPIPKGKDYLINVIDSAAMLADIKRLRPACDLLIVFLHFGVEYEKVPNTAQKNLATLCAENGVDALIGSHPHVLQPVDVLSAKGNATGKMVCAFSLGNFISNQRWRYSDAGAILQCSFEKNTETQQWQVKPVTVVPTWVYKGSIEGKKTYRILKPSATDTVYNFLLPHEKNNMLQAFEDTRKKMRELDSNTIVY